MFKCDGRHTCGVKCADPLQADDLNVTRWRFDPASGPPASTRDTVIITGSCPSLILWTSGLLNVPRLRFR
jgi:hypothetical protein